MQGGGRPKQTSLFGVGVYHQGVTISRSPHFSFFSANITESSSTDASLNDHNASNSISAGAPPHTLFEGVRSAPLNPHIYWNRYTAEREEAL